MQIVNQLAELRAVRRVRLPDEFSQRAVARTLRVSRQTLSAWEAGKSEPSVRQALALARLYGVTVEELGYQ